MAIMKAFNGLVLCDWHNDHVEVHVSATLCDGTLTLSCFDLGHYVEEVLGDADYEYWYVFDRENTEKLFSLIHGEETALLREFSGEACCRRLRKICKKNKIEYCFNSYI